METGAHLFGWPIRSRHPIICSPPHPSTELYTQGFHMNAGDINSGACGKGTSKTGILLATDSGLFLSIETINFQHTV